jgi:hypothetical protein
LTLKVSFFVGTIIAVAFWTASDAQFEAITIEFKTFGHLTVATWTRYPRRALFIGHLKSSLFLVIPERRDLLTFNHLFHT